MDGTSGPQPTNLCGLLASRWVPQFGFGGESPGTPSAEISDRFVPVRSEYPELLFELSGPDRRLAEALEGVVMVGDVAVGAVVAHQMPPLRVEGQ